MLICSTHLLPLWKECLHYPSHPQHPPQRAQSRREHLKNMRSARSSLSFPNLNLEPTQHKDPNQTQLVWGFPLSSRSLELTRPCATPAFPARVKQRWFPAQAPKPHQWEEPPVWSSCFRGLGKCGHRHRHPSIQTQTSPSAQHRMFNGRAASCHASALDLHHLAGSRGLFAERC